MVGSWPTQCQSATTTGLEPFPIRQKRRHCRLGFWVDWTWSLLFEMLHFPQHCVEMRSSKQRLDLTFLKILPPTWSSIIHFFSAKCRTTTWSRCATLPHGAWTWMQGSKVTVCWHLNGRQPEYGLLFWLQPSCACKFPLLLTIFFLMWYCAVGVAMFSFAFF